MTAPDQFGGRTALSVQAVIDTVLSRLPGVQAPVIEQELRWTVQRFLEMSRIWKSAETFNVLVGKTLYMLPAHELNPSILLIAIEHAFLNGARIGVGHDATLTAAVGLSSLPYVQADSGYLISLAPPPVRDGVLVIDVSLTIDPSIPGILYPDVLLPYTEAILFGVESRLMAQPGRSWTDPVQANMRGAAFTRRAIEAKVAASSGRSTGAAGFPPVRFGR